MKIMSQFVTMNNYGREGSRMSEEILHKCKEISDYLIKEADPYTEICITQDSIKVKKIEEGIPIRAVSITINCPK